MLAKRPLDAEPHLPIALGAALEVQAQVLAARGNSAQAVALLRRSLMTYRNTSIQTRLQKNLNLLGLGRTAGTSAKVASVPGPEAASGPAQRFSGSAFLLGTLVLRLQG